MVTCTMLNFSHSQHKRRTPKASEHGLICYDEKIMIRQDITGYDFFVISQNCKDFHRIFLRVSVALFSIYNFTIQMQVFSRHFEDGRPTTEKSIPYVVFIQQLQETPEQQKWGSNQQTSMYYTQPTKKEESQSETDFGTSGVRF